VSVELLEEFDGFATLRNNLHRIAQEREDWAGIPLPLNEDLPLVVEPRYPNAQALMALCHPQKDSTEKDDRKIRNTFYCSRMRCHIAVYDKPDGGIGWGYAPSVHHFDYDLRTMGASVAWGVEQEARALQTLAQLLPHHAFKKYLLTGMFLESSPRSHVTYMFRRLKPTVAMVSREGQMWLLCALCLHPIAFYNGSWAGAMCPTDDVIAHLMLMRGNEPMFWRRANQHPASRAEAGL